MKRRNFLKRLTLMPVSVPAILAMQTPPVEVALPPVDEQLEAGKLVREFLDSPEGHQLLLEQTQERLGFNGGRMMHATSWSYGAPLSPSTLDGIVHGRMGTGPLKLDEDA